MIKVQNIIYLKVKNASFCDLIRVIFIQLRIIPTEVFDLSQKLMLILGTLLRWNFSINQVVNNMCILGNLSYIKQLLIEEVISNRWTIRRENKLPTRQMTSHNIFNSIIVLDCNMKLLQQKNPPN